MQKPVMDFRIGCVELAVWKKTMEHDGRSVVRYDAKFNRRYKDRESGEWKDAKSFRIGDLPALIFGLQKALEHAYTVPLVGQQQEEQDEQEQEAAF